MKPCPTCGRLNTVHWTDGSQACYGCKPPVRADYELSQLVVPDADVNYVRTYMVPRRYLASARDFLDRHLPIKGKIEQSCDTGLCGNDAIAWEVVPVDQILRGQFEAFPVEDTEAAERHFRLTEHTMQRAAEDALK